MSRNRLCTILYTNCMIAMYIGPPRTVGPALYEWRESWEGCPWPRVIVHHHVTPIQAECVMTTLLFAVCITVRIPHVRLGVIILFPWLSYGIVNVMICKWWRWLIVIALRIAASFARLKGNKKMLNITRLRSNKIHKFYLLCNISIYSL